MDQDFDDASLIATKIIKEFINKNVKVSVGLTAISDVLAMQMISWNEEQIDAYLASLKKVCNQYRTYRRVLE